MPEAGHAVPGLTTVRYDAATLGAMAARIVADRRARPDAAPYEWCLTPRLVLRDSAPPPGAGPG